MLIAQKTILRFYCLIAFGLLGLGLILFFQLRPEGFKFCALDVGQGDAIFIRTPQKLNILLDGGPDNAVLYKLGKYLPFFDRTIDLMILSHPHSDHVAGLVEVLKRYQVKRILTTGVAYSSPDYAAWLDLIAAKNIPVTIIDHSGRLSLGPGIELDILFPDASLLGKKLKNVNNASIVAKLSYQGRSIMLMGDYEDEEILVKKKWDLTAEILKAGHHGSKNANDLVFLKAVNPVQAVISCGQDNKFGHPHQATLANLAAIGVKVFRTDLEGDFCLNW